MRNRTSRTASHAAGSIRSLRGWGGSDGSGLHVAMTTEPMPGPGPVRRGRQRPVHGAQHRQRPVHGAQHRAATRAGSDEGEAGRMLPMGGTSAAPPAGEGGAYGIDWLVGVLIDWLRY